MGVTLLPHTKGNQQLIVKEKDTALAYGSRLVPVLATPAMIALMELTALSSINHQLPDELTTVGFAVDMKHLKASKIGNTVVCESELVEVTGRKLVFKLQVWDEGILAGEGTHIRYIIEKSKFI
ncbi:MAG: thioesterase family protein [Bacteroidales bacterium]|nr:thioesterase family protein [Bacteroidales bacterium]HOI31965.1 thioesterase family protein [Bacteroidales bacterium]